jgi:hypothetical protein
MERLKTYIEKESIKNWKTYISYLNDEHNHNDLEKVLIFMFEDVLPESILKDEKSMLYTMSKSEKITLLDNPEPFLHKYIQNIFKREKNVDELVIRSIIKTIKPYKENLEKKKDECIDHMKKITQFFVDLKRSERILLTNKSLDFSFKNKNVLVTKLLNPYELGEIFGRYLLAHMFDNTSSNASIFYKNIFAKIYGKDYKDWHILLKYWIFLFIIIEQLFKKSESTFTPLFNIKLVRKLLKELCVLKYGPSEKDKKGKHQGKRDHKNKKTYKDKKDYKGKKRYGGGNNDERKITEADYQFLKYAKKNPKKAIEKYKKDKKKDGKKPSKYEDRNKFINIYNKILKETKVYNIYNEQDKNKKDDTLYNIFLENQGLKDEIRNYYNDLLFGSSSTYCGPMDEKEIQSCDFKKKVPIIFATQNPDAYFSIENDLFGDKTGPKKEYLARTRQEDRKQILDTIRDKITIYKSYYVYDDEHFNYFVKDLRTFQLNLIYLIYILYLKKFNVYKVLIKMLEDVIEDTKNELNSNDENNEISFNKNNESTNKSKNVIKMVLARNYKKLDPVKSKQLDYIYTKLVKLYEIKDKVEKNEFGTPNYDDKITKINKFIQLIKVQIEKILEQN